MTYHGVSEKNQASIRKLNQLTPWETKQDIRVALWFLWNDSEIIDVSIKRTQIQSTYIGQLVFGIDQCPFSNNNFRSYSHHGLLWFWSNVIFLFSFYLDMIDNRSRCTTSFNKYFSTEAMCSKLNKQSVKINSIFDFYTTGWRCYTTHGKLGRDIKSKSPCLSVNNVNVK